MATLAEVHNRLIDRWDGLAADLRVIARHLRANDTERVLQSLRALFATLEGLSSDSDEDFDDDVSSGSVEPVQAAEPSAAAAPFPGRSFRLD